MLKFVLLKCWNHSTTNRNYAVTYSKTLEEVPWHLGLKKLDKNFQKAWKLWKLVQNCVGGGNSGVGGGGGGQQLAGGATCLSRLSLKPQDEKSVKRKIA